MKINDLCPKCLKYVEFDYPVDFDEYEENEAIEGLICPYCKTKLVIYFEMEPSFFLREAEPEEIEELIFKEEVENDITKTKIFN